MGKVTRKTESTLRQIDALVAGGETPRGAARRLKGSNAGYFAAAYKKWKATKPAPTTAQTLPPIDAPVTLKLRNSEGLVIYVGPKRLAAETLAPYMG